MTEPKARESEETVGGLFDEDDEDTMRDKYLTFVVADEQYGIAIRHVTEIVGLQRITEVPDLPGYVRGVINLRGQVIPVVDVRLRFAIEPREYDERTCIIVVDLDSAPVGLIVDRVSEVVTIPEQDIAPPPSIHKGQAHRYVQGMGKVEDEVKILLDLEKFLTREDLGAAAEVVEAAASA